MTTAVIPLRPEGRPLTREQRALVRSVPGLAELVVRRLALEIGGDPRSPDRLNLAHLGIYKAAQTYDPGESPFPSWARLKATSEILTAERRDGKQKRLVTAARLAGLRLLTERRPRALPSDATDQELIERLAGLAKEQLVTNLLGALAADEVPAQGDDEIEERDTWAHAMDAALRVLDTLQPRHRDLLLRFAHGDALKAVADERGVDYGTLRDDFHAQIALVHARLTALNVTFVPTRPEGARAVLPDPRDPAAPSRRTP